MQWVAPTRLGPQFRWLLGSAWTSNLADGIALAAAPLLVASQTRDPFLVGMSVMVQRLPWLLFALLAGVLADRIDRRRIVLAVDAGRALVLAVLIATIAADVVNVGVVLAALFVLGSAEVLADTTSQTLLPMLVPRAELDIGNARLMTGFVTLNQLAGPPVGALLFAVDPVAPFALQAALLLVAASLAARLPPMPPGAERAHIRREIVEGLRWLWDHAAVRTLTITIVTFNVTYGAAWSVLVLYAIERLDAAEIGFGLLTTAVAIGGLVGTGTYDWLASRVSLGNLMRAGLIIETVTHLALALTDELWIALVILVVFGAHAFVWGTTARSVRQRAVPNELQGRVGSTYLLGVQGGIVVGSALGGFIADGWGVLAPFWFAFGGSALLVVLIWPQLPHIAHAAD